jgi:pimeloyl-ACP methyl ester carboxylesterase
LDRSIQKAEEEAMPVVDVSAGPVEYEDTGGRGPVLVFLHGLLMDGAQWRHVVADLRRDFRCVLPTLPMGAHRRPMHPDANLSLRGQGRIIAEFLEAAELSDVTLCFNDWCGAQVMIADELMERVAKLVLVSCEAFDNYPPGVPGRGAATMARLPGGVRLLRRVLLTRPLRNLPTTFGAMSKKGVPDEVMREWLRPLARADIRRDFSKYAGDTKRGRRDLLAATETLGGFERPVLVVWAAEDRVMPVEHGRRLADSFPNARLVEIADSYTLVPEDQPAVLAAHLRDFVAADTLGRTDAVPR